MTAEQILSVVSAAVSIIALVVSLVLAWFVWKRFTVSNMTFMVKAIRDRFEMFQWLESPITEDELTALRTMPERYFHKGVFAKHYKDAENVDLRRYVAALRTYHYLLYCQTFTARLPGFFDVDMGNWLTELWASAEFRHVHLRWKRYYREFREDLERTMPASVGKMLKEEEQLPSGEPDPAPGATPYG